MAEVKLKTPETIERDGIIFFKEPYKVNGLTFAHTHLDCDAIFIKEPTYNKVKQIVCYAADKSYNTRLNELFIKDYKGRGYKLLVGISSKEVNCID